MSDAEVFMRRAVALARDNIAAGGRPFGAVLVKDGQVLAEAANSIHASHDPTDHAEMRAIRHASARLQSPRLEGCVIYASGHPCPMCLAAMYLCGIERAWFAYSNEDAQPFGLSTAAVYARLAAGPAAVDSGLQSLPPAGEEGLYAEWARAQA
ncbi:CMP deaminase [Stenotrophomonas pictorum JCM 9942]|uniref:CMP deaminase n=1 Tax=Stenotrophomonas pictorum JCM 9942 TaxID=1236960 RepID=A0A0R0ACQ7_9GAMM|nr:nucleoside deaminase [Stenotrophomonas pictorum]KRG42699.1 CMP deaminase [Stenotrophomonas pictorum JCM 9942]